jgi:hypothetical protein
MRASTWPIMFSVRRQGFMDRLGVGLKESRAHLWVKFLPPASDKANGVV